MVALRAEMNARHDVVCDIRRVNLQGQLSEVFCLLFSVGAELHVPHPQLRSCAAGRKSCMEQMCSWLVGNVQIWSTLIHADSRGTCVALRLQKRATWVW